MTATEEQPLPVFIHLTKAAGHTMRALLHQNYPGPHLDTILRGRLAANGLAKVPASNDGDMAAFVAEVMARQAELAFVAANVSYGIHKYLHRPVAYISVMREPVDRCISYWYFAHRERATNPAWSTFERHGFDLAAILGGTDALQLVDHQVRTLSGTTAVHLSEEHLDIAKDRIAKDYLFVGATERFDECLGAVARLLGWTDRGYTSRHIGDRSDASLLPAGASEAFAEANPLDHRLHEWLLGDYLPSRLAVVTAVAVAGGQPCPIATE